MVYTKTAHGKARPQTAWILLTDKRKHERALVEPQAVAQPKAGAQPPDRNGTSPVGYLMSPSATISITALPIYQHFSPHCLPLLQLQVSRVPVQHVHLGRGAAAGRCPCGRDARRAAASRRPCRSGAPCQLGLGRLLTGHLLLVPYLQVAGEGGQKRRQWAMARSGGLVRCVSVIDTQLR